MAALGPVSLVITVIGRSTAIIIVGAFADFFRLAEEGLGRGIDRFGIFLVTDEISVVRFIVIVSVVVRGVIVLLIMITLHLVLLFRLVIPAAQLVSPGRLDV